MPRRPSPAPSSTRPRRARVLRRPASPYLATTFPPTDSVDYNSVTANATINVQKTTPTLAWANPADINYGTTLGTAQLDATASVSGTFVYAPAAGALLNADRGQTLSATLTPADAIDYTTAVATATINVQKAAPAITWADPANITYGTTLGAAAARCDGLGPPRGRFAYTPAAGSSVEEERGQGQTLSATFTPTDTNDYTTVNATATINVQQAAPTITWANPADITYGTTLGAAQLDATTPVAGRFVYSPAAGALLKAGQGKTLSATFTPTDTSRLCHRHRDGDDQRRESGADRHLGRSRRYHLWHSVFEAGQALDAMASVPGLFAYTPPAGTVLSDARPREQSLCRPPSPRAIHGRLRRRHRDCDHQRPRAEPAGDADALTWTNPPDIVYGTALGGTQLDAAASFGGLPIAGTFTYAPAAGTVPNAGQGQTLAVTFNPTDAVDFSSAGTSVLINVTRAPLTVTVNDATKVYGEPNPAFSVAYSGFVNGDTASSLTGTLTFGTAATSASDVGSYDVSAGGLASNNYAISAFKGSLSITPAAQTITWSTPADITFNTPLGADQLNATVTVPGPAPAAALTYTPAAGTFLAPGSGQTLTVVAAATRDYTAATASVPLDVLKGMPVLSWAAPADIPYPTALGAAQLDAVATFAGAPLAGTFAYTPAAGMVLSAGTGQTLSAVFTPADTTDFDAAPAATTINVIPATPLFDSLAAPTIVYGTSTATLSGHLAAGSLIPPGAVAITLDGTTEAATIDPTAGTFSASFATSALGASSSPHMIAYSYAATTNFAAATAATDLTVNKADQTIAWTSPAGIVYGTPLGAAELDATVSAPGPDPATGMLSYSPAAGTVLGAGAGQSLMVSAAATNNYNAATLTVTIDVQKATPAVAWANPADIVYGTPLGAAQLDAATSVAGTFAYTPAAGALLDVGQGQTLSAAFTPDDTADYNAVPATAQINVTPAPLTVAAENASIAAGQALPAFTARFAGFVRGDGPSVLGGVLGYSVPPGAAGQAGSYAITPSGLTSANYAITYVNGTLDVTQPTAPPVPPVTVHGIQLETEKLSHHKTAKVLVVTFSGALNAGDAQNLAAYHLVSAGKDKKFGTKDDPPVKLAQATYSSGMHTVTLTTKGTVPSQTLQLMINTAVVLDAQGQRIAGNGTGQSGGNFVESFGKGGITLASTSGSPAAKGVSAEVFDALLLRDQLPLPSGKRRGP